MSSSVTPEMTGGPIISISDMDNFMKIGESAQCARRQRPIKRTSSMDFDLLRASGNAARRRRGSNASEGSTCGSPSYTSTSSTFQSSRSTPCSSPLLRPIDTRESRYDFMVPVHLSTPWKVHVATSHLVSELQLDMEGFAANRDSFIIMGLDVNVGSPFEVDSPFEIGMASELRIVNMDSF